MRILGILLLLSFNTSADVLSKHQLKVKQIAKEVGSQNCIDNTCFTSILQAIAWQESSYGKYVIGDSKGTSYYYLHNNKIVPVKKEDTFLRNKVLYCYLKTKKTKYLKQVHRTNGTKLIQQSSLGAFQIKVPTAIETVKKMELKKYYPLLKKEDLLVNELITNHRFSAIIAVNILKMQYNQAKKNNVLNPKMMAVSRYNGGNNNLKYIGRIMLKVQKL